MLGGRERALTKVVDFPPGVVGLRDDLDEWNGVLLAVAYESLVDRLDDAGGRKGRGRGEEKNEVIVLGLPGGNSLVALSNSASRSVRDDVRRRDELRLGAMTRVPWPVI